MSLKYGDHPLEHQHFITIKWPVRYSKNVLWCWSYLGGGREGSCRLHNSQVKVRRGGDLQRRVQLQWRALSDVVTVPIVTVPMVTVSWWQCQLCIWQSRDCLIKVNRHGNDQETDLSKPLIRSFKHLMITFDIQNDTNQIPLDTVITSDFSLLVIGTSKQHKNAS